MNPIKGILRKVGKIFVKMKMTLFPWIFVLD